MGRDYKRLREDFTGSSVWQKVGFDGVYLGFVLYLRIGEMQVYFMAYTCGMI